LKEPIVFKPILNVNNQQIMIFKPDFPVFWEVQT